MKYIPTNVKDLCHQEFNSLNLVSINVIYEIYHCLKPKMPTVSAYQIAKKFIEFIKANSN